MNNIAYEQARQFLVHANTVTDDPRRTRIDLLQVANHIARRARQTRDWRELIFYLSRFLEAQQITSETLERVAPLGWPHIDAAPGPVSYFHSMMRLTAHAALRKPAFIRDFERIASDVEGLIAKARRMIEGIDPHWANALIRIAADSAVESQAFRRRLIAAAKDVQQLVTGDELPRWDAFAEGPAGSDWPPLSLGVYPIAGGRFDEDPSDWDSPGSGDAGGAAVLATGFACVVGFGGGAVTDLIKMGLCILGVIAFVVILIVFF